LWAGGSPSRLTIPAASGITKVRLSGLIHASTMSATRSSLVTITKNGSSLYRGLGAANTQTGLTTWMSNVVTGVIDVIEGDYFEITIQVTGEAAETILAASSYFQIEVVEVASATDRVFDISTFAPGISGSSATILQNVLAREATLRAGGGTSQAYAATVSTAAKTYTITKNGVSAGTIDLAIGANAGTFTVASDAVFAIGDRLAIVAPATPDATLADISITLDLTIT